jgi:pimeloyl-ACP methyl ester carboxylesterase
MAASALLGGAGAYLAGSWLAGKALARLLISPEGLEPVRERREDLLTRLRESGASVVDFRYRGSRHDPVELAAVFACPPPPEVRRPTVLFLHGKGGAAAEWRPEALRALACGYAVLLPDLRAHGESRGEFFTYGLLEKDDLANAIEAARERFGLDPARLGLHACSAGSFPALEYASHSRGTRALWIESPYADAREMARHYLSLWTGLPAGLLGLTSRWAVASAVRQVRRQLDLPPGTPGLEAVDPIHAIQRIEAPVCLVYGERDELVPPGFVHRFEENLPPGSEIWKAENAGHCHHEDEPARVAAAEYDRRWRAFFSRHLPLEQD